MVAEAEVNGQANCPGEQKEGNSKQEGAKVWSRLEVRDMSWIM